MSVTAGPAKEDDYYQHDDDDNQQLVSLHYTLELEINCAITSRSLPRRVCSGTDAVCPHVYQ